MNKKFLLYKSLAFQCVFIAVVFAGLGALNISAGHDAFLEFDPNLTGAAAWKLPPTPSDQLDYLSIGIGMSKRLGYTKNSSDPDFRKPFEELQAKGFNAYDRSLTKRGSVVTAYRMPMFPFMLSLCFRATGYNFIAPRIMNCLLMGAAAVFVFLAANLIFNRLTAFVAVFFLLINLRIWDYVTLMLTETAALFFVAAALFSLVLSIKKQGSIFDAAVTGLVLALGIYTRGAIAFFVPFFAMAYFFNREWGFRKRLLLSSLAVIMCGLALLPWIWRNNTIGGRFVGISTQSGTNLPAGYTDVCLKTGGRWDQIAKQPYAAEMLQAYKENGEWAGAVQGQKIFWRLVHENPMIVPLVTIQKLKTMLLPNPFTGSRPAADFVLISLSILGVAVTSRKYTFALLAPIAGVLASCVVFFANARFAIPMAPALALFSASAIYWIQSKIKDRAKWKLEKASVNA